LGCVQVISWTLDSVKMSVASLSEWFEVSKFHTYDPLTCVDGWVSKRYLNLEEKKQHSPFNNSSKSCCLWKKDAPGNLLTKQCSLVLNI